MNWEIKGEGFIDYSGTVVIEFPLAAYFSKANVWNSIENEGSYDLGHESDSLDFSPYVLL